MLPKTVQVTYEAELNLEHPERDRDFYTYRTESPLIEMRIDKSGLPKSPPGVILTTLRYEDPVDHSPEAAPMTIGEWRKAGFVMRWSIYDQESKSAYDAWLEETEDPDPKEERQRYMNIRLDLSVPAGTPDGAHRVRTGKREVGGQRLGRAVVKNGRFIPAPTERAIFEAVCAEYGITEEDVITGRAGLDHIYIEKLSWDAEQKELSVFMGS